MFLARCTVPARETILPFLHIALPIRFYFMFDFKRKNVLITGGSRGIGLSTAIAFATAGANVAFTYRSNHEAAVRTQREIESKGVRCLKVAAEANDESALQDIVSKIGTQWGALDVAVANAGIWKEAAIPTMTLQDFRETMDINMTGTYLLARTAAQPMIAQQSGSMVFVSSTAGQRGEPFHSHYAASKGAQISFTKSLAVELAPHHIRVNCVAPGWTETDMTEAALADPSEAARIQSIVPLRRAARPEEIANAILFLASPLASYITGEVLNVNGGMVLCG